jgi:hypothetical protein
MFCFSAKSLPSSRASTPSSKATFGGALLATPLEAASLAVPLESSRFNRPKGENRTAQGFSPGRAHRKEDRPERAADYRALFPEIRLVESDSMAFRREKHSAQLDANETGPSNITYNISARCLPIPSRTPFQGDFLVRAFRTRLWIAVIFSRIASLSCRLTSPW